MDTPADRAVLLRPGAALVVAGGDNATVSDVNKATAAKGEVLNVAGGRAVAEVAPDLAVHRAGQHAAITTNQPGAIGVVRRGDIAVERLADVAALPVHAIFTGPCMTIAGASDIAVRPPGDRVDRLALEFSQRLPVKASRRQVGDCLDLTHPLAFFLTHQREQLIISGFAFDLLLIEIALKLFITVNTVLNLLIQAIVRLAQVGGQAINLQLQRFVSVLTGVGFFLDLIGQILQAILSLVAAVLEQVGDRLVARLASLLFILESVPELAVFLDALLLLLGDLASQDLVVLFALFLFCCDQIAQFCVVVTVCGEPAVAGPHVESKLIKNDPKIA